MKSLKFKHLFLLIFLCLGIIQFLFIFSFLYNLHSYDVIVIGSDPEGISAAVSSSRNQSKVLLIDTRKEVGGLYTSGMLSMLDMNYIASNTYSTVNEGFFKEFYDHVAVDANIDIEKTKSYFSKLLEEENVDAVLGASMIMPIKHKNSVTGLSYMKDGSLFRIKGKVFIDASPDAQFARKAGAAYKVGREELGFKNKHAAATLVFSVKNVDWIRVKQYLNTDNSIYTGATSKAAWGYPHMLSYTPSSENFQLRALNLSLQDNGSVVINAFQIFNTNPLNKRSLKQSYEMAIRELPYIIKFLNTHAVGFEKAVLDKYANELYIREGVRIIGEYTLTGEDLFNNKNFKNKIAYGSYPMDLQSTKRDSIGGVSLAARNIYTLPITIMVPKKIDNVLVVGRSASYDPLAHSSARTVPVGMALGQAAGALASYSIDQNLSVRVCSLNDIHVKNIQQNLVNAGVILNTPLNTNHPEKSSWSYPYIVALRKKALVSMEHNNKNNYRCNDPATLADLCHMIDLLHANSDVPIPFSIAENRKSQLLTSHEMITFINSWLKTHFKTFDELYESDIINQTIFKHINEKKILLNEDLYAIMHSLVQYISQESVQGTHVLVK